VVTTAPDLTSTKASHRRFDNRLEMEYIVDMNETPLEYTTSVADVPDEFRIGTCHYLTRDGAYELAEAIDGEWVRCIDGESPWGGPQFHRLNDQYQDVRADGCIQVFQLWDGVRYSVGVLLDITCS